MSDVVRIKPVRSWVDTDLGRFASSEIRLGGVPRGAVLVLVESAPSAREDAEIMNELAAHGYEAVAADLGSAALDSRDPGAGLEQVIGALSARLAARGWSPEQIGLLGYDLGGRAVLAAAIESRYAAAVSVAPDQSALPVLARVAPYAPVQTPWLGLFGTVDDDRDAELAGKVIDRSPVHSEIVRYAHVRSDFYRHSGDPLAHAAAFDAWQRTVEWFNLRVAPRLTHQAEAWFRQHGRAESLVEARHGEEW